MHLLIAHFKYTGTDFEADMKGIADDEETQRWWKLTDGMQESFEVGATGSGKDVPWWTVSARSSRAKLMVDGDRRTWRKCSDLKENHRRVE